MPSVISGSQVTSGVANVLSLTTGAASTPGTVTGTWTLTAGSTWEATFADLAEHYAADAEYEPGTVLIFGGEQDVTIANTFCDTRVAGVVSTSPAYIMNTGLEGTTACIALQGLVPVKVVGIVNKGDLLVASDIPGYAIATSNVKIGSIIGKAIDNKTDDAVGTVRVSVGRT
jgi:hypothetical protein